MRQAFVVLIILAWASPALAQGDDASAAFSKGKKLFAEGDYVGAIEAFNLAYKLRPHYLVRCNIALCYERRSDFVQAAEQYRACLEEGASKTPNARQVRTSLRKAETRIATVEVSSSQLGDVVFVDGDEAGKTPYTALLNPGKHVIEVRREGATSARKTLVVRGGEKLAEELSPIPVGKDDDGGKRRRPLSQIWFWAAAGLTVALAATAAGLGAYTIKLRDDYVAGPTRDLYDRGRSVRLATNVLWGLTAAAGIGTGVLFFFTDFKFGGTSKQRDEPEKREVVVGLSMRGTF